jgi:hypothetical protein
MPHAEIDNPAGFGYEPLFVTDTDGRLVFVPLLQAAYLVDEECRLRPLDEQPPPQLAGEWYGDPEFTSVKWEPQIAFQKLATDIVLHGHAYPVSPGASHGQVGIRVGTTQRLAHVFGDRCIVNAMGEVRMTEPLPFERIPLTYERCYGGWDRRQADPSRHSCEPRNPVGVGYYDSEVPPEDGLPVPNIEDPERYYEGYGDRPPPAGFGFISANWQPRAAFAGTYDEHWDKARKPLLPTDFDIRFFNAATPALITSGYLRGDEDVVVVGASPDARIAFRLPGIVPPICQVELRMRKRVPVQTVLDTVVVDADERKVSLIWRGYLRLPGGAHDVMSVEIPANGQTVIRQRGAAS